MLKITVSNTPPADDLGHDWGTNYAIMVELIREFWEEGDILLTASLHGRIVGVAHITQRAECDRLESLASVFPHAGKLLLGRAISIARGDRVYLDVHSRPLPSTVGFYRHCPVLHELDPLHFVSVG